MIERIRLKRQIEDIRLLKLNVGYACVYHSSLGLSNGVC